MAAIEDAGTSFVTPAEMRARLESDEITAKTDVGDWPTPDTSALWARFRNRSSQRRHPEMVRRTL